MARHNIQTAENPESHDERDELDCLIGKLGQSLQHFSFHAHAASETASDYQGALVEAASRLEAGNPGAVDVASLARLTRTMIDRTRHVAEELQRSDSRAEFLRNTLEQARRRADIDPLTGLSNRRAFEALLEMQYGAAREAGDSLSVAFCNIDNFKQINETHGHDTGDRVIRAVARVLQRDAADNCHVARHGGQEFVLLYRGVPAARAREKIDQIREKFSSRTLVDRQSGLPIGKVSFSGGTADVFAYDNASAALDAANEGVRRAKEQGRNQIVVATQAP